MKLHLGVEADFRPARKTHPALPVRDLAALVEALRTAGHEVSSDEPFAGVHRVYVAAPFGNPIELMEPMPPPKGLAGAGARGQSEGTGSARLFIG